VYPGAVVMLGGDFINGDIHEELQINADRTTQQNINELSDVLAAGLETMATRFGRLFVPCVVGNHGRSTRKPRLKGRVITNHEWNIYVNLERYFRSSKHVSFMVPESPDAYFSVAGTRYLLTHGDSLGVKGGDGIIGAIGPIMRGTIKIGNAEGQVGRDFDYVCMGHWHQPLWLPGCIVNGALKGHDEYAHTQLRAPYSRPSQLLWFTHPEHGVTAKWEVFLEGRKHAKQVRSNPDVPAWVSSREGR
jgi:predicted phosphodiesterase